MDPLLKDWSDEHTKKVKKELHLHDEIYRFTLLGYDEGELFNLSEDRFVYINLLLTKNTRHISKNFSSAANNQYM